VDALKPASATSNMIANIEEERLALEQKLAKFDLSRQEFLPLLGSPVTDYADHPETAPLHLPSDLELDSSGMSLLLQHAESELRFAQAMEALAALRRSLCTAAHFTHYKNSQVNSQHSNTRARTLQARLDAKTRLHADCYRRARRAYIRLNGPDVQEDVLQDLRHEHVRTMQDSTDATDARAGPREGHRLVSWIWSVPGTLEDAPPDMEEGLLKYSD
jgi:hypothetical protein